MKRSSILSTRLSHIAAMILCFVVLVSCAAYADCSEDEYTAVFILENIQLNQSKDMESFWQADTFNCANLDSTTPDNHAWWCGTQFEVCEPGDPIEGYGNSWNQWLGWQGTVPNPDEPVTVTVRAHINLDSEVGFDYINLKYLSPQSEHGYTVWQLDGFTEDLLVEQIFTIQPEDYTNPFDTVHLQWAFQSDGAWSDEDCLFPSAGGVQIDLIEVYFDQGSGPVQMGNTETCEPGSELQWTPEIVELELTLLDVAPVGPETNPSIAEMIEAVRAIQPYNYYQHIAQAGPFHLIYQGANDLGASAIVDGRDGRIIFAGTMVWMGTGSITTPVESSHAWSFTPGEPAAEPATVEILPSYYWPDHFEAPSDVTNAAVSYLTDSDVLRSFSDCGPYDVVSYIYTPAVYGAGVSLIVVVSGLCGPPWADLASAAPPVLSDDLMIRVFPNPFNPRTTVTFSINRHQAVEISVFDLSGKRIAILADGLFEVGAHSLEWGGTDLLGNAVASGTYFVRMTTQEGVTTQKMMLVK